jgi:hypothetical protein
MPSARSGRLGLVPCGESSTSAESRLPAAVVAAGCALEVGRLSHVIDTDRSFYIVRALSTRPASHRSFERARGALRRELAAAHRSAARDRAISDLRAEAELALARRDLVSMLREPRVPEREPEGPPAAPFGARGQEES